jgi:ferric-dicitrate binding protein FerR (iron transport regulator)
MYVMPDRISQLFDKFIAGHCTEQEYHELMDLLRENQHEEKVRGLLQQVYQGTARSLRSVTYVDDKGQLQRPPGEAEAPVVPLRQRRSWKVARAAVLTGVIVAAGWWLYLNQYKMPASGSKAPVAAVTPVKSATQRGEMKYLLLPDSTQVWLNVASTIEFPETFSSIREVTLHGEAFFDVKHAADHPFLIHTGAVTTKVLGTAFNIKAYPGQADVVVSVKRGKVEVRKDDKVMATLTMGQEVAVKAILPQETAGVQQQRSVAAWTRGELSYASRPLSEVLQDLERNYNASVELTDSSLADDVITTSFRRDIGIEEALDILCGLTNTVLKEEGGKYRISRK